MSETAENIDFLALGQAFIQFLFQVETWREIYRNKEAVLLTTKFNSASSPAYTPHDCF